MAKEESGRGSRLSLKVKILLGIVAVVAVGAVGLLIGMNFGKEPEPVITADLIGQQLQDAQELVSVDYRYTNMGKFENQLDFYGWNVPFTDKSFIVSYDGIIKAGVDLSQVKPEVNEVTKTVTVTLPESRIISHEIPESSIQVFNEKDGLFTPITIEDYTGFTQDQKGTVEQKAIDNGLLTAASQRAREAVSSLLSLMPGMDKYTLTVK